MINEFAQARSPGVCIVVERATGNGDDSSDHAHVGLMQPSVDAQGNVWLAEMEVNALRERISLISHRSMKQRVSGNEYL
jgi:hypothetical protein